MNRIYLILLITLTFHTAKAQTQATLFGVWDDPELIGSNAYDNTYNEVWGLAVGGHEYAIIGSTAGTHFIDVTNPTSPFEAHFVEGKVHNGNIIHRDYHDHKGYLYAVADEGVSSLQIMDISGLPDTVIVEYDDDSLIRQAHNIFIDVSNDHMYAFSTNGAHLDGFAMRIFDISDPVNPGFITQKRVFGTETVGHVHDGFVKDGIAFLNCGGDGLVIADFSDPLNPITLSLDDDYPDEGYCHSGWPSEDMKHYYMADENHGHDIKAYDSEDLSDISVVNTFNAGVSNPDQITHNQIVHGDYLYTSYYYDGLQVFDISDPANPQVAVRYDTYSGPDSDNFKGAWGVYPFLPSGLILISDMQSGLYVFGSVEDALTGITNLSSKEVLAAYPQPIKAGQTLTLDLELRGLNSDQFDFSIIDVKGSIVQIGKSSVQSSKLNIATNNNLLPGFYLVNVKNRSAEYNASIVVK